MKKKQTLIRLRAAKPNAGIRAEYQRRILAILKAIADDVLGQIKAAYAEEAPQIAQDASPASKLAQMMNDLRKRWERPFNDEAESTADWFSSKASANATRAQKAAMESAALGDFAVRYDFGNARADTVQAIAKENVSLIKTIGSEYFDRIENSVLRSVTLGRDLNGLAQELDRQYAISARRAALIARDQNNKATEAIARSNDLAAGVTKGEWIHVPGRKSSRASHKSMHGKVFDLAEGLYDPDEGRKVKPAELIACNCTYRPIFDFTA